MNRRTVLKGGFVLAATAHTAVASGEVEKAGAGVSIDQFLKIATPAEIVRYHANALADAMAIMHPDQAGWRVQIEHQHRFAIVAGTRRVGKVRAVVDDGSPLLPDDVTGTTAYADWERSRI